MVNRLSEGQLAEFDENGFLVVPDVLGTAEVAALGAEAEALYGTDSPRRTFEADGRTVRAVHGCHQIPGGFADLVTDARLLVPARQIVGGDVYVHQSKINAKRALSGDIWPWHQDFTFWNREDGMAEPRVVNVALFLDAATDHNGPLLLIPGSHLVAGTETVRPGKKAEKESWQAHLAADLEYTVSRESVARLSASADIVSALGGAGSLLFFDSRIVHGSGSNMSPADRRMAIFTYNSVDNVPGAVAAPRPDFLAARDHSPLQVTR
ncbi:phytanoyl-CoA dioxygenase family protein [Streptomyces spectabilis]|uniref:Ectoine hydroxylase n=1 Tax=Streptomyces spectabilis TaxID=68270 RepID=A0A5P2X1A9_STRST|nr:phytanoyl-CoA dioxygenase family protein [Streptomyces spectabilis]MBB5108883.1 ectoine hydroxylase [Streptomyces spectabilis]MCI3899823.1 phytanoyl-CoA dioxygenase family protein [Streptomyces spectabilis]QEV57484.1 phytanoyl-CoA dioxygenase [Streptomyces spectabilis]GGV42710.1 L-proline 4-hydroxylase [Streptomyces spectabilis]